MEAYTFDIAMDGASAVMTVGLPGELWQIDTRRGGRADSPMEPTIAIPA